jgi:hypothetical protein
MAEKKLPEANIGSGQIVDDAAELVRIRAEKAKLETKEKELIAKVAEQATTIRDGKLNEGEVVGLLRITDERAPIQVQFKVSSKEAEKHTEDYDNIYGTARPLLFERDTIITGITDPIGLMDAMKADNRNPFDFLEIIPKKGSEEIVSGYEQVMSDTRMMPKTGFLATASDVWNTLTANARTHLIRFIKDVCKASVVVGSKGNGK